MSADPDLPFDLTDLPGFVPYDDGLALQDALVGQRRSGAIRDTVVLLEHEPVFTIGRTRDRSSLGPAALLPHPVREINRGGQATYHGPGQLTGYLHIDLVPHHCDLHRYLRLIEDVLIQACAAFGVAARARPGLTGVWVAERKLASIGVGVRHWITMHGFGINLAPEALRGFQAITPCGLDGVRMTCLDAEAGRPVSRSDFTAALVPALAAALRQSAATARPSLPARPGLT